MRLDTNSERINIGAQEVGTGKPCYVIAEAGSNHNRDMEVARQMIDAAVDSGADAVKFQSFTADRIAAATSHPVAQLGDRFSKHGATLHELYKRAELPQGWIAELFDYAKERGITPMSTPFDEGAVDELVRLGMSAIKIASFELVHLPLIRHCAQTGLPMILSTGMASLGEIEEALEAVYVAGGNNVALLHCNIEYPPRMVDVELRAMDTMRRAFGVPVGFSDHTRGIHVPVAAVTLGACIIEKHYTLGRDMKGPDHSFALEPEELKAMCTAIHEVEEALGRGRKGTVEAERVHKERGRRSLFSTQDIPAGQTITKEMVAVLRPGVGLHPRYLEVVVGRTASQFIPANEPLSWEQL